MTKASSSKYMKFPSGQLGVYAPPLWTRYRATSRDNNEASVNEWQNNKSTVKPTRHHINRPQTNQLL